MVEKFFMKNLSISKSFEEVYYIINKKKLK